VHVSHDWKRIRGVASPAVVAVGEQSGCSWLNDIALRLAREEQHAAPKPKATRRRRTDRQDNLAEFFETDADLRYARVFLGKDSVGDNSPPAVLYACLKGPSTAVHGDARDSEPCVRVHLQLPARGGVHRVGQDGRVDALACVDSSKRHLKYDNTRPVDGWPVVHRDEPKILSRR
jgi:hypothetical protein